MLHFFFQQLHVATGSSWLGLYLIWWMYLPTCIRRIEILTNVNKTRRAQLKRLLTTYWWHDWGLNRFSRASTQRVRVLESGGASTSPSSSPLADSSMSCAVYGGRLVTNTEKLRTHSPSCSVCSRWATLNTNNTQTTHFTLLIDLLKYLIWSVLFSFPSFLHLSLPSSYSTERLVTGLLILKFISSVFGWVRLGNAI